MRKRLTNGNKKVEALLFSLPPVKSCLNHASCAAACYAVKAYKQYPSVRNLWDDNFDIAKNDLFKLYDDIVAQLKTTKKKIVRIHQSGDFFSQAYIQLWADIASNFPDVIFYGYTKVEKLLDISPLDKLPNVNIIRSMINGQKNFGDLNYITALATETGADFCPATMGENVRCGETCFKCMEKGAKIVFLQH